MPPKAKGGKKGGKKNAKSPPINPAEVIAAFQKQYTTMTKERSLDLLKLGPSEENGVVSTETTFARIVLQPSMPGPACELAHFLTLLDALAYYKYLQQLCVWQIPIGDAGCMRLARYLRTNKTVTRVELHDCGVTADGCAHLAGALASNSVLARLSLDHNHVRDRGVDALATALASNHALQALSLKFCAITPAGADACARLVAVAKLKELELHGNELRAEGATRCLVALATNTTLTRLGLACTMWGPESAVIDALLETTQANVVCNEYNIDGNPIGDAAALRLAAVLPARQHVTRLVTTEQLTKAVFHEIVKLTATNKKEWAKAHKKKKRGKTKK
jgi:Ran GTPase-activating protein (RanGAP) involved in mRNA processing and transport